MVGNVSADAMSNIIQFMLIPSLNRNSVSKLCNRKESVALFRHEMKARNYQSERLLSELLALLHGNRCANRRCATCDLQVRVHSICLMRYKVKQAERRLLVFRFDQMVRITGGLIRRQEWCEPQRPVESARTLYSLT